MYQTSEAFVRQMDTRPFRVLLTGAGGSLQVDSLEYSAGWCPTSFSLGNANAASFSAEYNGGELALKEGNSVALSASLDLAGGGSEQVPLGTFVLTKVERDADTDRWSLAGEDALSTRLEEEYFCADTANPPATAPELLSEICDQAGLALEGKELVPDTPMALEYDAAGGSGSTMRELVGQIALLAGANALVNRAGELRLCRLGETDCQVGPQRYYESGLTLESEEFVFGALEVTVTTLQQGDSGTQESQQVYSAQLEGATRGISFSSQWFDQTAFDGVWQAWQGKRWRPAQIEFLGDLRLDPGDLVTVTDRAGTEYTLAVMGLKHSFDGGFRTTVSCYGPAESGSAQPQTVSQAITGLKTDLGRFRRLYTDNLEATAAQIKHITTEDIVGEHGTINLAQGTFQFGDALVWDGEQMTLRGVLESEQGTIGGWTIDGKTLYSVSNGGNFKMELKPADDDVTPYIMMQGTENTYAWIQPYIGNYGDVQRLELICGDSRININHYGDIDFEGSGGVFVGSKIYIRTDGEGGNIRIGSPDQYNRHWEMDAYNGNFRLYTMTNDNTDYKQVSVDTDGNFYADGDLYSRGNIIADHVVAQGTSGSWTYRKWTSGVAECWARLNATKKATYVAYDQYSLPFSFTSFTGLLTGLSDYNHNSVPAWKWNTRAWPVGNSAVVVAAYAPDQDIGDGSVYHVSVHVLGRWK